MCWPSISSDITVTSTTFSCLLVNISTPQHSPPVPLPFFLKNLSTLYQADFYIFPALACYYESRLTDAGGLGLFLFGEHDGPGEPDRVNKWFGRVTKACWVRNAQFVALSRRTAGLLGTYSIRKFPATRAARQGPTTQMVETRGRWKGQRGSRVVSRYINPDQEAIDVKVAALLCVGRPVKYKLKVNAGVGRTFLLEVVVPKIYEFFQHDESSEYTCMVYFCFVVC